MEELLLEGVEDSRQDWKIEHSLNEILTVVMCGVSAGERSIHGICAFARIKETWLRNEIGLKLPH
ncbi:MAG: transposase family protein, partial [Kiritimatiellae bacterium]|nr:transposase family protein [Kiritimatiellia bacterium]